MSELPEGSVNDDAVAPAPARTPVAVRVNGAVRSLAAPTLHAALAAVDLTPDTRHVAIAVNDAVVARADWHTVTLGAHDRVEIITAVAGG